MEFNNLNTMVVGLHIQKFRILFFTFTCVIGLNCYKNVKHLNNFNKNKLHTLYFSSLSAKKWMNDSVQHLYTAIDM